MVARNSAFALVSFLLFCHSSIALVIDPIPKRIFSHLEGQDPIYKELAAASPNTGIFVPDLLLIILEYAKEERLTSNESRFSLVYLGYKSLFRQNIQIRAWQDEFGLNWLEEVGPYTRFKFRAEFFCRRKGARLAREREYERLRPTMLTSSDVRPYQWQVLPKGGSEFEEEVYWVEDGERTHVYTANGLVYPGRPRSWDARARCVVD